jgi:hypothetical protein
MERAMNLTVRTAFSVLLVSFLTSSLAHAANRCDEMWAAAMADDTVRVTELFNAGVNVNCRDPLTAETPLMAAAKNGKVDMVKFLLVLGADANTRTAQGSTALDLARSQEATFSKIPNLAPLAERQRKVIALLEPRTGGQRKPVEPVKAGPADPDTIARLKIETARAAMMGGLYDNALTTLNEIFYLPGVPKMRRAQSITLACEIGVRKRSFKFAKDMCEMALGIPDITPEDRADATENLKMLRKYHPGLFQ